jgi:hypothetical protein
MSAVCQNFLGNFWRGVASPTLDIRQLPQFGVEAIPADTQFCQILDEELEKGEDAAIPCLRPLY